MPEIASVIVWQNGMVMVFDEDGYQVPEYQGPIEEVRDRLSAVFPETRWEHGGWQRDLLRNPGGTD